MRKLCIGASGNNEPERLKKTMRRKKVLEGKIIVGTTRGKLVRKSDALFTHDEDDDDDLDDQVCDDVV